jgi:hypothetical protein
MMLSMRNIKRTRVGGSMTTVCCEEDCDRECKSTLLRLVYSPSVKC